MRTASLHPPNILRRNTHTPHQQQDRRLLNCETLLTVRLHATLPNPRTPQLIILQKQLAVSRGENEIHIADRRELSHAAGQSGARRRHKLLLTSPARPLLPIVHISSLSNERVVNADFFAYFKKRLEIFRHGMINGP